MKTINQYSVSYQTDGMNEQNYHFGESDFNLGFELRSLDFGAKISQNAADFDCLTRSDDLQKMSCHARDAKSEIVCGTIGNVPKGVIENLGPVHVKPTKYGKSVSDAQNVRRVIKVKTPIGNVTKRRSKTGCWTCRSRRKKCAEEKPFCFECMRLGLNCDGYDKHRPQFMTDDTELKRRRAQLKQEAKANRHTS